jgi:hypothetical protein
MYAPNKDDEVELTMEVKCMLVNGAVQTLLHLKLSDVDWSVTIVITTVTTTNTTSTTTTVVVVVVVVVVLH